MPSQSDFSSATGVCSGDTLLRFGVTSLFRADSKRLGLLTGVDEACMELFG